MEFNKEIVLTTINAKWIHPSLALRLLKANLGDLENHCEILEFALRQPLREKIEPLLSACPRILGISVSIWNHLATIELLSALEKEWADERYTKPIIVLGGPEVSYLPADAEIFKFADHVIRGEGEHAFRTLCERILGEDFSPRREDRQGRKEEREIKSAYYLYTDDDVLKKLIYVESSRGCKFNCEFCLSAIADNKEQIAGSRVYEFPLDEFINDMDILIQRGVKTFKFLDRSFNTNIKRSLQIIEFFLGKIEKNKNSFVSSVPLCLSESSSLNSSVPLCLCERSSPIPTVHFEMVPSIFPDELRNALTRFPPGSLRLEIGIQTLNPEVAAIIRRPSNPEKEIEALRFLSEKTNAIIHADLIAGLPGEDLASFGKGFDLLLDALFANDKDHSAEIQLGILKLLPGAPISHHSKKYGMRYNSLPPYEVIENSAMSPADLCRIKNFARFWEIIVNRGLMKLTKNLTFEKFLVLSDYLLAHFGKNWGIDKKELKLALEQNQYLVF